MADLARFLLLAWLPCALCLAGAPPQPNLVLIYVDDLGYGDLGAYGHPVVETPNIDSLARDGAMLTQYYAPAPLCSPSRAALLTGRTPYRTGIRSWIPEGRDIHIGEHEITLAHLLAGQGYRTAVMGKWHLNGGFDRADHPQPDEMGFQYRFVMSGGWAQNARVEAPTADGSPRRGAMYPDNFWRNGEPIGETDRYSAELVTDEALAWLDEGRPGQPFFLYLPYSEVHTPVASPSRHLQRYADYISESARSLPDVFHWDWNDLPYRGSGEYYANIGFLDEQIGRVLDKLDALEVAEHTIVIFASDNGPVTRESRNPWEIGMAGETGGLRGRKHDLFEGGIRVPGLVRYPGVVPAGRQIENPVHGADWLPTLAAWMGFETPRDRPVDGRSVATLLQDQPFERDAPMIWSIDIPDGHGPSYEWAIRDGDWKLILDRDEQPRLLFNLAEDHYELDNRIEREPARASALVRKFQVLFDSISNDPVAAATTD